MECKEKGCGGEVDLENPVSLRTRWCEGWSSAFVCRKCGCVYWLVGDEVHKTVVFALDECDQKIYVIDGEVVINGKVCL